MCHPYDIHCYCVKNCWQGLLPPSYSPETYFYTLSQSVYKCSWYKIIECRDCEDVNSQQLAVQGNILVLHQVLECLQSLF